MGVFQTDGVTGEILFSNGYISAGFFDAAKDVGTKLYEYAYSQPSSPAALSKFTADYILETIAHEIGHMIGLQHNFQASNIGASRAPAELPSITRDYFDSGRVPADLSTSVMEYLPIPLAEMLGRRMRTEVLAHDLDAVSRAYFGNPADLAGVIGPDLAKRAASLPYCNDENADMAGCTQFDHAVCSEQGAYCFTSSL